MRLPLLWLLLSSLPAFAQVPTLEISGANFRAEPLGFPRVIETNPSTQNLAEELDKLLLFDFGASGLFRLLDRASFLAPADEPANNIIASAWLNVGAESVIKVQLNLNQEQQLEAHLRLFRSSSGRLEFETSAKGGPNDIRKIGHQLANAVYRHYTAEEGPFLKKIAFVKTTGQRRNVYIADWDGNNAQALTQTNINLLPAFTSNNQAVAFTSYDSGNPDIVMKQPGGKTTTLVAKKTMATGVAFSKNGKWMAWAQAEGESTQLWLATAHGKEARKLTQTPFLLNTSPNFTPDGKNLVFVSNRAGGPQLFLMDLEKNAVRRLTFQGNYNQTPKVSPKGDWVAFTARDEKRRFDIFITHLQTGEVRRVTQDQGDNEEPSFSPDGRLLLFVSNRLGSSHIFVSTLDGKVQLPLPLERSHLATPIWSN
ncbi:MAG: DPP IV N-terminal domain-containing protein [Proteobacteria bacterium]|nr:DPP IV N-terminal domain-containing protein [Pseudomonadota bacterium]